MNARELAELKSRNEAVNDQYVADNTFEDVATFPKLVTYTSTLRCNYRCFMCYQGSFTGDMDMRIVERTAHVLPHARTVQVFGGEPLLFQGLGEILATANSAACDIEIISNGSLLDSRRRSLLLDNTVTLFKVSLEAATQETYASIRGGDLAKVFANIRALAEEREQRGLSHPTLQINFVAMQRNIMELADTVRMASDAGVSRVLVLYMNCGSNPELAEESLYLNQNLSDQGMIAALDAGRETGVEVSIPGLFSSEAEQEQSIAKDRTCHSPWKNCLIDIHGNASFCCGGAGKLGNVLDTPFDELWHSEKITRFRRLVNTPEQPSCCVTCRVKGRNHRDPAFHFPNKKLAEAMRGRIRCAPCAA